MIREEVLDAWRAWNNTPTNSTTTNNLCRAEKALGLPYGLDLRAVHDVLVAWHRAGQPIGVCIDAFVAGAQVVREKAEA